MKNKRMRSVLFAALCVLLCGCTVQEHENTYDLEDQGVSVVGATDTGETYTIDSIPAYNGTPYVVLSDNEPDFSETDRKLTEPFEFYSDLDALGRCGQAYANVCRALQPTEKRGEIGQIKPTGWHTVKYSDVIEDRYLYNRCHLIGYQLSGENANEKNLITGTRYMNVEGMLPFENRVDDYVDETGNHVLYRVTPLFEGDNLVASGVEMEAWSVEDEGAGICFHVYCYNVQPGISIDYATGDSWETGETTASNTETVTAEIGQTQEYIVNENTGKFHLPECSGASEIAEKNRRTTTETAEALKAEGYAPCARCLKGR